MLSWLTRHPVTVGLVTVALMLGDWMLTVLQERERSRHYHAHFESFPVDSVEGNPALQSMAAGGRLIHPRHLLAALVIGVLVAVALIMSPGPWRAPFLGYIWGMFLVVITQHLSNLLGYRAGREGVEGKIRMHQRTAYITQAGRYLALTILIGVLAVFSASPFVAGVAVAALVSSGRQVLRARKVPRPAA